ncbi:TPA: helix-turn-helix transcriptional regulator [Enterococcus faecalis]|uniref:helix-turn-helix domain-containing protein n=1 Tax=Enterococcus faecalis TaxID=1351 RepID=UPI00032F9004|nr:helix-turn-helix transcriptional regulator [Enterococcus faecalis]EOD86312.1 hypothetical protein Q93_01512 [Enterococcus faecalis EnGen0065]MDK6785767.1 helix-turn-helix transcriptional regulator [Enterococcus faecalis]MDK7810407.1 helix-turn-helix transcriptional regulator [Enterococcus faecalis]MDQ6353032.1 helix-turn-helix domain-containing protein [Enterococcus faecalis]NJJ86126.1 helix-turn-helix transcriptional regulator [Enterococcus faecalis]
MKISFGERLIFLRKRNNLSQEKLAEVMNKKYGTKLNKGMISKWENNREIPQMSNMKIIANFFNTSVDFLIEDEIPGNSLEDWFDMAYSDMPEKLPTSINENDTPEYFAIQRKSKKLNRKDQQRLLKIMEATFEDLDNNEFEENEDDDL